MRGRIGLGIALGLVACVVVIDAIDAEARGRRRRGGRPAREVASDPSLQGSAAPDFDGSGDESAPVGRPVAGDAFEGDFRQDVVDGGTMLAMGPDRALLLNAYRGLSVIDTTDPSSPGVLGSVAVEGTGERMFLGDGSVVVLSSTWSESGSETVVTLVDLTDDSDPQIAGAVRVEGSLRDAVREGDQLCLVTADGWYGPLAMEGDASSGTSGDASDGAFAGGNARSVTEKSRRRGGRGQGARGRRGRGGGSATRTPTRTRSAQTAGGFLDEPAGGSNGSPDGAWYEGGSDDIRVARVDLSGASPSLDGAAQIEGSLLAQVVSGDDAVLVLQQGGGSWDVDFAGGDWTWTPPTTTLVVFGDGASGPEQTGSLELTDVSWVSALDRSADVVRAVLARNSGAPVLATFDLSGGGDPVPLGSIELPEWPSVQAFSGDVFAFGATTWEWNWDDVPGDTPDDEPGDWTDPSGGNGAFPRKAGASYEPTYSSSLRVIDLADASAPVLGGEIPFPGGWFQNLVAVPGGVAGILSLDKQDEPGVSLFRVDLTDPTAPSLVGEETLTGWYSLGERLDDLLLLSGGSWSERGGFEPSVRLVDLGAGGLTVGGEFAAGTWASAFAREGDLLGVASFDRLVLANISDVTAPEFVGELRLVVNVADLAVLSDDVAAALVTDYVSGRIEIRTVSLPGADVLSTTDALDTIDVGIGDAQLFAAPPYLYVVATDWATGRAFVQVVDATDPSNLRNADSLDLASYPGQVFLHRNALLLLREAWSLVAEDEEGEMRASDDPFGRCRKSWLRDELSSVLDVVDLRDPENLVAAERLRLRWDWAGAAVLAGDTLYVPSYVDVTGADDEWTQYAYGVRPIDVNDPLNPVPGRTTLIPGSLVGATSRAGVILTAQYLQSRGGGTALHLVDLSRPWEERRVATYELDGYPTSVTVGRQHVYVVEEIWPKGDPSVDNATAVNSLGSSLPDEPTAQLLTLDLDGLALADTDARERGAWDGRIQGGHLFLRSWGWSGAIDVYGLAAADDPVFERSAEVLGLAGDVEVAGDLALVPAGLFGIQTIPLGD